MTNRMKFLLITLSLLIPIWILAADPIVTNSTADSKVTSNTTTKTTIRTNPPSAISPSINASGSDLCTVGVAGAVQTQIIGISTGQVYNDENCVRLKNAKVLYDMGMKVAAVALMCQSRNTPLSIFAVCCFFGIFLGFNFHSAVASCPISPSPVVDEKIGQGVPANFIAS